MTTGQHRRGMALSHSTPKVCVVQPQSTARLWLRTLTLQAHALKTLLLLCFQTSSQRPSGKRASAAAYPW